VGWPQGLTGCRPTKGYKTRKNKSTDKNIIRRRKRKK
jgi:ribosomal protein L2